MVDVPVVRVIPGYSPTLGAVFLGRLENEFSSHAWSSIPTLINLFDSEKERIDR